MIRPVIHRRAILLRLMISPIAKNMGEMKKTLDLTPNMIVRDGRKVIAHEVASRRARIAYARRRTAEIHADPLYRASAR